VLKHYTIRVCYTRVFVRALHVARVVLCIRARTPSSSTNIKKLKKNNNTLKHCATRARYTHVFAHELRVMQVVLYNCARTLKPSTNIKKYKKNNNVLKHCPHPHITCIFLDACYVSCERLFIIVLELQVRA
jgi:hypothetical protein